MALSEKQRTMFGAAIDAAKRPGACMYFDEGETLCVAAHYLMARAHDMTVRYRDPSFHSSMEDRLWKHNVEPIGAFTLPAYISIEEEKLLKKLQQAWDRNEVDDEDDAREALDDILRGWTFQKGEATDES